MTFNIGERVATPEGSGSVVSCERNDEFSLSHGSIERVAVRVALDGGGTQTFNADDCVGKTAQIPDFTWEKPQYIEYFAGKGAEAIAALLNLGFTVENIRMEDQGWLDGMKSPTAEVTTPDGSRTFTLRWYDSASGGQWMEKMPSGGWGSWRHDKFALSAAKTAQTETPAVATWKAYCDAYWNVYGCYPDSQPAVDEGLSPDPRDNGHNEPVLVAAWQTYLDAYWDEHGFFPSSQHAVDLGLDISPYGKTAQMVGTAVYYMKDGFSYTPYYGDGSKVLYSDNTVGHVPKGDVPTTGMYRFVMYTPETDPEAVWRDLNLNTPAGMRSMTMGDIVVVNGMALMADEVGFTPAPWFNEAVAARTAALPRVEFEFVDPDTHETVRGVGQLAFVDDEGRASIVGDDGDMYEVNAGEWRRVPNVSAQTAGYTWIQVLRDDFDEQVKIQVVETGDVLLFDVAQSPSPLRVWDGVGEPIGVGSSVSEAIASYYSKKNKTAQKEDCKTCDGAGCPDCMEDEDPREASLKSAQTSKWSARVSFRPMYQDDGVESMSRSEAEQFDFIVVGDFASLRSCAEYALSRAWSVKGNQYITVEEIVVWEGDTPYDVMNPNNTLFRESDIDINGRLASQRTAQIDPRDPDYTSSCDFCDKTDECPYDGDVAQCDSDAEADDADLRNDMEKAGKADSKWYCKKCGETTAVPSNKPIFDGSWTATSIVCGKCGGRVSGKKTATNVVGG